MFEFQSIAEGIKSLSYAYLTHFFAYSLYNYKENVKSYKLFYNIFYELLIW